MAEMYTDPDAPSRKPFIVLLLLIAALLAYVYFDRERVGSWLAQETLESKRDALTEEIVTLQERIAAMEQEDAIQAPPVPEQRTEEVFGSGTEPLHEALTGKEIREEVCEEINHKLKNFFAYLDGRDYIGAYELRGGTREYFKDLAGRLLANPPAVTRETDSLLRVLKNSAHFFRVLGKKETLLLRNILKRESDIMEPSFELLYQIVEAQEDCRNHPLEVVLPLDKVYAYAAFFLNTLGGRSYLMRRDSRVRMLTQYYAVRILDQASLHNLNRWGIDIRYPLESLIVDLEGSHNLNRGKDYLRELKVLGDKYRAQYGELGLLGDE